MNATTCQLTFWSIATGDCPRSLVTSLTAWLLFCRWCGSTLEHEWPASSRATLSILSEGSGAKCNAARHFLRRRYSTSNVVTRACTRAARCHYDWHLRSALLRPFVHNSLQGKHKISHAVRKAKVSLRSFGNPVQMFTAAQSPPDLG